MSPGAWIVLAVATLAPQAPLAAPDPPVHLRVGVYTYNADGSLAGSASGTADEGGDAANIVWVAMGATSCGAGAGMLPSRPDAITWKWTGRVLGQHGADYLVQVKEGRVSGAAGESWPRAEHNALVRIGGSIVLDEISATAGPCSGRIVRLEARVEPAAAPSATGAGSGARSGTAAGGRAGGGRAAPAPPSVLADRLGLGRPMNVNAVIAAAIATSDDGFGEQSFMQAGANQPGLSNTGLAPVVLHTMQASFRAELWLVDTAPEGASHTEPRVGHLDDGGGTFSFTVPGALSTVAVNLRPMWTADQRAVLRVVLVRTVVNGETFGMSNRAIPLPGPGEVISFEMPISAAPGDPLAGHRFEVRVRLTPAG